MAALGCDVSLERSQISHRHFAAFGGSVGIMGCPMRMRTLDWIATGVAILIVVIAVVWAAF
jgi:hypothetical protein